MSRIHEALRRGGKSAQPSTKGPRSGHADTILATLGYRAESSTNPRHRLVVTLLVTTACAAAYFAWPFWPFRQATRVNSTVAARNVAAPRAPVRPTPSPSTPPAPSRSTIPTPAVALSPVAAPAVKPATLVVSRPVASSVPPTRTDFQLGLYYQRAGEFDRAFVRYKAVLQRDELNVEAHNNLGLLYKSKGLTDEAMGEFLRAISIAPRYVRAHNNLGVMLLELGRVDAAAAEFRSALSLEPRNVDAIVNLALAQRSAGQTADAQASLSRALAIEPHSAAAHYNLGQQYEDAGETVRAIEHYRAFLQYAGPEYEGRAPDVRARIVALQTRIR